MTRTIIETPNRRTVLGAVAAAPAALLATQAAFAADGAATGAAATAPGPRAVAVEPLPFDPGSVTGLSRALLESHHDNNYAGAVRRLTAIRADLAAMDFAAVPPFRLNGLKREELIAWNSKQLHELYFGGIGKPTPPSAALDAAMIRDFGSADRWRQEFVAMAKALGGGSGWVVLTWVAADRRLANIWASDHSQSAATGVPLLAIDMYEHAYAIDFGARAGAYVDAFMAVVDWTQASRRFAQAQSA